MPGEWGPLGTHGACDSAEGWPPLGVSDTHTAENTNSGKLRKRTCVQPGSERRVVLPRASRHCCWDAGISLHVRSRGRGFQENRTVVQLCVHTACVPHKSRSVASWAELSWVQTGPGLPAGNGWHLGITNAQRPVGLMSSASSHISGTWAVWEACSLCPF